MPRRENCLFLKNRIECSKPQATPHFFCAEHKLVFASLDNAALLEQTARAMRAMTYVSEDKKITANADPESIDAFINRLHEVLSRGYTREEALSAIADVIQDKGIVDDQLKEIGKDPKWKKFEKLVAGIHMLQADGADVKFNDHVIGIKTKSSRQIDVSIRFHHTYYDYLTIVECKDTDGNRKVEVTEVEAFAKKMEDVGALHGVMVSPNGFQKGAIETAKFEGIELFTLQEIKSDWTKRLKKNVFTLPVPESIEFDHPYLDSPFGNSAIPITYAQIVFHKSPTESIPLTDVISTMGRHIVQQNLALPFKARVEFDPYVLYRFPMMTTYTPIYAVIINFEPAEVTFKYEIDVPPKLVSYRYSDIRKETIHEFPAKDIPKVD